MSDLPKRTPIERRGTPFWITEAIADLERAAVAYTTLLDPDGDPEAGSDLDCSLVMAADALARATGHARRDLADLTAVPDPTVLLGGEG